MEAMYMVIEDWYSLVLELHKYYKCHRCSNPTCCKIAVQLTQEEIFNLSIAVDMSEREFFRTHMQTSPIGLYLKNPCPFLKKGKESKCTMHHTRPFMCKMYPFSSIPGVVLNFDICPLSRDIVEDVQRLREKAIKEKIKVEFTEMEAIADELAKEVTDALPVGAEEVGDNIEGMINALDELAPKSEVEGMHDSIKTHVHLFRLLLEEKQNGK